MQKTLLFVLTLLSIFTINAQAQRSCGAVTNLERQLEADPGMAARMEDIERHTDEFVAAGANNGRAVVTIPVVFHIIHDGDAVGSGENISDTYINAQLDQLNKDFRKLNSDVSLVPSVFAGLAADAEVQFCLAQRKPDGTATNGIERLNKGQASWTMNQCESSLKPTTIWDRNKYLNLWTVVFGGSDAGTLGYAQFPGGTATTDGVVLLYSSLGSVAVPNSAGGQYGKGRTATHEVGHWLNLRHIWGDANCGNDQVSDTPTQQTSNYGCPSHPHVTCSNVNGDMFMNYMDYVDDACMYMFSAGQKARMQALFATGGSRVSLATSDGCTPPSGGTTCGSPSSLATASITSSSAALSWAAVTGATSYNVQYKTSSATTWTTTTSTTNSTSLSGLAASTTYNWQVQAVCSSGTSAYVAGANFTTSAATGTTCTDTYESNNSKSTAKTIAKNTDISALIGTSTDVDWFTFTTTSSDMKVKINLSNLAGDYDVKLYKSSTLVATSQNSGTTAEQIIYNATSTGTYYVYVYGYSGAFSASQCYTLRASTSSTNFVRLSSGAAEDNVETPVSFNVYPNPVRDIANVELTAGEKEESYTLSVFDITGRQVTSQQGLNNKENRMVQVDCSGLSNGMYIVRIESGNAVEARRIMVNHK